MKKALFLVQLFLLTVPIIAGDFDSRVTYIWDVTYSMHGGQMQDRKDTAGEETGVWEDFSGESHDIHWYNEKYDIYKNVVEVLVEDIKKQRSSSELVVILFTDRVIDTWRYPATDAGKDALISKIRGYNGLDQHNTYISVPMQYAIDHVFTEDTPDVLKLLTDGKDNDRDLGKFKSILSHWCEIAEQKDVYAFYVMLTNKAEDGAIKDIVLQQEKQCGRIHIIPPQSQIVLDFPTINVSKRLSLSVKEDYGKELRLEAVVTNAENMDEDVKVRVYIDENQYIALNDTVSINKANRYYSLKPMCKMSQDQMRAELPQVEDMILNIHYEVVSKGSALAVGIQPNSTELALQNKSQKKLKIYVKKHE